MVRDRAIWSCDRQAREARTTLGNLIEHLVGDYTIVKVGTVRKGASLGENNSTLICDILFEMFI